MYNPRRTTAWAAALVFLAVPMAVAAQAPVVIGGAAAWPRPAYAPPVAPYGYAIYGPWPLYAPWDPCRAGACVDSFALRRYIAREIRRQELANLPESSGATAFARPGESPFGMPRYLPPPTPESEIQPRFRGSGEVLPRFRDAGQPLQQPGG
jgi:hypothetical protein